jgi:hypothetical protein
VAVTRAIRSIGTVWDELVPRIERARRRVDALRSRRAELGDRDGSDLDTQCRFLDRIGAVIVSDPLAVDASQLDACEAALERLAGGLEREDELRSALPGRIADARSQLAQLATAAEAEVALRGAVAEKIANIASAEGVESDRKLDELRHRLDDVDALCARGQSRAAQESIDAWCAHADHQAAQLESSQLHARALLARRSELRGLLDAYVAKAEMLGRAEDRGLAAVLARARAALYTAPTDLDEAAQLVNEYRSALGAALPSPGPVPR